MLAATSVRHSSRARRGSHILIAENELAAERHLRRHAEAESAAERHLRLHVCLRCNSTLCTGLRCSEHAGFITRGVATALTEQSMRGIALACGCLPCSMPRCAQCLGFGHVHADCVIQSPGLPQRTSDPLRNYTRGELHVAPFHSALCSLENFGSFSRYVLDQIFRTYKF